MVLVVKSGCVADITNPVIKRAILKVDIFWTILCKRYGSNQTKEERAKCCKQRVAKVTLFSVKKGLSYLHTKGLFLKLTII